MKFWDSSALVAWLLEEPETSSVRRLLVNDADTVLWWGTPVECSSALQRRRREGRLDPAMFEDASRRLVDVESDTQEVTPSPHVRERAKRLLSVHSLTAADALQLAAALTWCEDRPTGHEVISLDRALREAARQEGFTTLP